jgi:hypothetical protein
MYVRFRLQGNRLQASLVQGRRAGGKVHAEHVGALGSVDAEVSVRSRVAFWAKIHDRLAALGNRVGTDEHAKILGALHGRIPMVTPEDIRAVQEESFADDERFWDSMRDMNASHIEGLKGHIALAASKIATMEPEVAKAAEKVEVARSKREKLKRGEAVAGGLKKQQIDVVAILKAAGFTPRDFSRLRLTSSLSKAEFETALANTHAAEAADKAFDREARRLIRGRAHTRSQGRDEEVRERVGVVFQARFLAGLAKAGPSEGPSAGVLRLLEANGPQDHPNNDDEEAEPECFDDQLLEPLRGQSIPPPAGQDLGFGSGRLLHKVAGTLLVPTASRPRLSMLSWGEVVYDPNAGRVRKSQDARRPINPGLARSVPALNFAL